MACIPYSTVNLVVRDGVSDYFDHEWEDVSGNGHSQPVSRGPLLGVACDK